MQSGPQAPATSLPIDALHLFVEMLSELDAERERGSRSFYDRLCEAVCRLTSMERAGLLLYDKVRRMVVPVGSHGAEPELMALFYGTLDETPVAQQALAEDRVVKVADVEGALPDRYAHLPGLAAMTCVPVAAGGRWLGVLFADRGGEDFTLPDDERQTMWILGKIAALAASARMTTAQQERGRSLSEHFRVAQEVHERVMQRLFGVSMVLGGDRELLAEDRARCADELQSALAELRAVLARPLAPEPLEGTSLRDELARLGGTYKDIPLRVGWEHGAELPVELEHLAVSSLAEALRNAEKHAEPTQIEVTIRTEDGAFSLQVRNDGVGATRAGEADSRLNGSGMGLRLASLEAVQRGGVLEFGPGGDDAWRVRLVLPLADSAL